MVIFFYGFNIYYWLISTAKFSPKSEKILKKVEMYDFFVFSKKNISYKLENNAVD
jgi:hypothetical protein